MWRLIFALIKKQAKSAVKSIKNVRPANIAKTLKKTTNIKAKATKVKNRSIQVKRKGSIVKRAISKRHRLSQDIARKIRVIHGVVSDVNEMVRWKSNAELSTTSTTNKYVENTDLLKLETTKSLEDINNVIDKELESLGIKNDKDFATAEDYGEGYYDLIKNKSYDTFMDNWRNGFFAYDPEDLGMSEDEREKYWEEIMERNDFAWFQNKKIRPTK